MMKTFAILGIIAVGLLVGGMFFASAGIFSSQEEPNYSAEPSCSGCSSQSCSSQNNCGLSSCGATSGKTCGCNKR